jgi:hypothetical protein
MENTTQNITLEMQCDTAKKSNAKMAVSCKLILELIYAQFIALSAEAKLQLINEYKAFKIAESESQKESIAASSSDFANWLDVHNKI